MVLTFVLVQQKMKRATVGPFPGVTQDIAGYKVRNIYTSWMSDYAFVSWSVMAKILCTPYC